MAALDETPRQGIHPGVIAVVLLAVIGVGGWVYWSFVRDTPPAPPAELAGPTDSDTAPAEVSPPPPALILPELDQSDPLVRELVGRLSAHPTLISWLVGDDLVRAFVAAVDQVARGESPRGHLGVLAPEGDFEAAVADTTVIPDPSSYARYDLVTEVVTSLDTAGMGSLYQQMVPLFEQAYRDLGFPDGGFDGRARDAVRALLATPDVETPSLVPTVEGFRYRDPALEALAPAQKHLLRMGPDNARRLKEKLRQLAVAAGLL